MICLIWTHGKEKLVLLINNYHSDIKFTHEFDKENISFLPLKGCLSFYIWMKKQKNYLRLDPWFYLVRAKLFYSHVNAMERAALCMNINETTTFTCSVIHVTHKISY